nr:hypothetical protein [Tanacetum cinerariifolium]
QQSSHRSHGHHNDRHGSDRNSGNGRDQRNRGHQSNRSTNSDNSSHQGEYRRAVGTCFKSGQAGHLQKDFKTNTTTSTSGQADKKLGASGRVFAITKGHAANTSEHHAMIDCRSYRVIFGDTHAP